jgi:hypothetical protein
MRELPEAWKALVGERLAGGVLDVTCHGALRPNERLNTGDAFRLCVAAGLIVLKGWPRANDADEDLRVACFVILLYEHARGLDPLPRGSLVLVPLFGWKMMGDYARPIVPIVGRYWDRETHDFRAKALDPFDGRPFDIADIPGSRSPDRWPMTASWWHGPIDIYLASDQSSQTSPSLYAEEVGAQGFTST